MNNEYKSIFKDEITTYLRLRQAELGKVSYSHNKAVIVSFDNYLNDIGYYDKCVTMELIESWIKSISIKRQTNTVGQYVHYIRQLMKYLISCGYRCVIPENIIIRDKYTPYLYSYYELERIFHVADSFKALTAVKNILITVGLPMILRLLYCCGLRLGEVVNLQMGDIDLENGILTLKVTKKYKQRLVPMHNTLTEILKRYCMAMGIVGNPNAYLFPGIDNDTPLAANTVRNYFKSLLEQINITRDGYQRYERGPCLHCFRHVFTVRSFKLAEERGIKITDAVPFLSTYLGHDSLYETEKYLKFNGELFPDTTKKIEAFTDDIFPEVQIDG